jgi:DNA-binding MarR family transcriptional regulator
MELGGGPGAGGQTVTAGAGQTVTAGAGQTVTAGAGRTLATGIAAGVERLIGLVRSLSPADGLSLTAAATLATLERSGPRRLTGLAVQEGVTQPAMTQLISRLEESGLVRREASPEDGRVVMVVITDEGRSVLARRRSVRSDRMAAIIAQLRPEHRAALAIALPALDALASVPRDDDPARATAR